MISRKTFNLLGSIIRFGNNLKNLPWTFCLKKKRLQGLPKRDFRFYKIVAICQIMGRILFITYLILTIMTVRIPIDELMLATTLSSILFATVLLRLVLYTRSTRIILKKLVNWTLGINEQQMKFYNIKYKQIRKDSTEKFGLLILRASVVFVYFAGPCFYYVLSLNIKLTWLLRFLYFPGIHSLVSIGGVCFIIDDCSILVSFSMGVSVYLTVLMGWMRKNICQGPNTRLEVKMKLRIFFRAFQVLHRSLEEFLLYLIPILFSVIVAVLISTFYSILVLYNKVDNYTLICVTIVFIATFTVTTLACQKGNELIEDSKRYSLSFQRLDKYCSKFDRKFFKSLRPLGFHVGPWLTVDNDLLLLIIHIVITYVINLIVT